MAGLPGLRVVIITGSGRAFCAGGDLIEFEEALQAGGTRLIDTLRYNQDVLQMVEDLPVPVIGAANGTAVAGGLELLLCCDIIIAAEGAKIGDGHARYGIVPAGGATVRLAERISPSHAAQLFYTAALVDAETLARWGLVNEVVPREQAHAARHGDRARDLRAQPGGHPAHQGADPAHRPGARADRLRAELERFEEHISTARIWRKGLAAFTNKQPPHY